MRTEVRVFKFQEKGREKRSGAHVIIAVPGLIPTPEAWNGCSYGSMMQACAPHVRLSKTIVPADGLLANR